ncbi:hypothetical protein BH24ACT5_BH24ACT5_15720 [soil metagenome]
MTVAPPDESVPPKGPVGTEAVAPGPPGTQHVQLLASLMAIGAGVIWSLGVITVRTADNTDAFQYMIWRSAAIVIVIEVMARWRGRRPVTPAAFRSGWLMVLACVCLLTASSAFVYAVKNTAPANAAFLGSTTPLLAVVLARFALGERLTRVTGVAVAMAFVGLLITVSGDLQTGNMVGNASALLAALGFAGYTVCLRSHPRRSWSPVMPGYALMMIVLCVTITVVNGKTLVPPIGDIVLAALHGGAFIVLGTLLFNRAARQIPAVAMTVLAQSEMLFVTVWAFAFLHDEPTPTELIGGLTIVAAVVGKALVDTRRSHPAPSSVAVVVP